MNACAGPQRAAETMRDDDGPRVLAQTRGKHRRIVETAADGSTTMECGHVLARADWWAANRPYRESRRCWLCPTDRSAYDAARYAAHGPRLAGREREPECAHGHRCRDCLPGGDTLAAFIAAHPDGATIYEVGEALGLSHERVRQIEIRALAKLAKLAAHIDDGRARLSRVSGVVSTRDVDLAAWERRILDALADEPATRDELESLLEAGDRPAFAQALESMQRRGAIGLAPRDRDMVFTLFSAV